MSRMPACPMPRIGIQTKSNHASCYLYFYFNECEKGLMVKVFVAGDQIRKTRQMAFAYSVVILFSRVSLALVP